MAIDLTPESMANNFAVLAAQIASKAEEIKTLDREFTILSHDYKRSYGIAFLAAEYGETKHSNDVKRLMAEQATSDKDLDLSKVECNLRAVKEEMKVLRDRLEIGRSMSAIMRMEWSGQ